LSMPFGPGTKRALSALPSCPLWVMTALNF